MKLSTIDTLYVQNLKYLHSTEKQLESALTTLAKAADAAALQQAITEHQKETQTHRERIEKLLTGLGESTGRKKAAAVEALVAEADEIIAADGDAWIKDIALIDAAQRAEHIEIAVYGCTETYARLLGRDEDAQTLHTTLEEERKADLTLTRIALEIAATEREGESTGAASATDTQTVQSRAIALMARQSHEHQHPERSVAMPRRDQYDDYEDGRSQGGYRSSQMQDRDEYGQFAGYSNRGQSRYEDDDRGNSGRYRSSRYEQDDDGGRYSGRSQGGYRSSQMQDRDEYGQFAGYSGRAQSRYDDERNGGGTRYRSRYDEDYDSGPYAGRAQGGYRSSQMQDRDEYGQFAGYSGRAQSRYQDDDRYDSGRRSSRYDEDDDRRYSGRSQGGYRSSQMQDRDEYGQFAGYSGRGQSRYDEDDRGFGSSRRSNRDQGGDYVDSAGRHYTRESWERAQEGRSLGGQHSHSGGRSR